MAKYWKYVLVGIGRGRMTVLDKHIVHRSASGIYAIKEGRTSSYLETYAQLFTLKTI